jgi:hypothetical protein
MDDHARRLIRILQAAGHLPVLSENQIECALGRLFDEEQLPPEAAARLLVAAHHDLENGARGLVVVEAYYKNDGGWFKAFNEAARVGGEVPFRVWSQGWSRSNHDLAGFVVRGPLVAEHADGDPDDGGERFSLDTRNYLYSDPTTDEERARQEAELAAHLLRIDQEEGLQRVEGDEAFDAEFRGHATFQFEDHEPDGLAGTVSAELAACGSPLRVYAVGRYSETTCVFLVTTPAVVAALRALGQTIGEKEFKIAWAYNWWPGAGWSAFDS